MIDCSELPFTRARQICEGTSGLPPEIEEAYRQLWALQPPGASAPADFSCLHRGDVLRQTPCESCGGREGIADVHACQVHGECTVHAHGVRRDGAASDKLAVCVGCPDIISASAESSP